MVIVVISSKWDSKVSARSGVTTKENSMLRGGKPKKTLKERLNRSYELGVEVAISAEIETALEVEVEAETDL